MVSCPQCDCRYSPERAPGGQCPRCLLLGVHLDNLSVHDSPYESSERGVALEDDELAAELPGFVLEQQIGRGGMSAVWRARERVLDRCVAIKLLRNETNGTAFVERFTREARVLAKLHHPNIITMFSFGRTRSNHCYLVMALVEGTDLSQLLTQGPMDVLAALKIINDVCIALQHAHGMGFVHRDVKPGNILLDTHGNVKVADFGLARLVNEEDTLAITKHGWAVGTPLYTAPEQAIGKDAADHRVDIYSAGVMLYQMLTGELPRGVFAPPSSKRKLDPRLDTIIMQALQEDPQKRYQSIEEFRLELEKVRRDIDPAMIAVREAERHQNRWRHRGEFALGLSVAALLGIISAWYARPYVDKVADKLQPASVLQRTKVWDPTLLSGISIKHASRLQPPMLSSGAHFGKSLSLWGDWLAVAAPDDRVAEGADGGGVYLYFRNERGEWSLKQRLAFPQLGASMQFAASVAMAQGVLAVGSIGTRPGDAGRVDLYELKDGKWTSSSDQPVLPDDRSPKFGQTLVLNEEKLAVLEPDASPPKLHTFTHLKSGGWSEDLNEVPRDGFSVELVSLDGPSVVAVARSKSEALLLRRKADGVWNAASIEKLPGSVVDPEGARALAANQGTVVLGSSASAGVQAACIVLREVEQGALLREGELQPPKNMLGADFGAMVATNGSRIAVGARNALVEGERRGAICLFQRNPSGRWVFTGLLRAPHNLNITGFGTSIALGTDCIVVGAPDSSRLYEGAAPGSDAPGAVLVYQLDLSPK